MTLIGRNIRKIRTLKKLSQASFADLFNLTRPSVGAYEEGRAEPKIDSVLEIANYFSISVEKLLTKELTINEIYQFDIFNPELNKRIESPEIEIPIVETLAFTEYQSKLSDKDFTLALPKIKILPHLLTADIAFELPNDLHFNTSDFKLGEIIFCTKIKKEKIKEAILYNSVYFVFHSKGMALGNLMHKNRKFVFKSNNSEEPDLELQLLQVNEIWKVTAVLNKHFDTHHGIEHRLKDLETKIELLDKKILTRKTPVKSTKKKTK
ncbi:MAG: helix-turn-helix domain-containing protein [Bacteroidota bacterium]|nr:helix-turn-helix domain-containing protein [Bacteroidota bacterium]